MSTQLSYNLLPAHRCANNNFRRTFLILTVIELFLTTCSTITCFILSICIFARRPFIILHTTFHPFIQASIFLTAAITQLFKLASLLYCGGMIVYCDGEIFLSNARLESNPSLEQLQSINSPNDVARRCFTKRQLLLKRLRKIIGFYPITQLLCGTMTLAFWCSNEEGRAEGHIAASRYYRLLRHIQGPSNCIFLVYLISWCFDLFITPIYLLITTWHYARVDWQIQVLTAQAPPYFPSRQTTRDGSRYDRSSYRGDRIWERKKSVRSSSSTAKLNIRKRGRLIVSRIKDRITSTLPRGEAVRQNLQQHCISIEDEESQEKVMNYDKREPASVPVSPSESLYSHYSDTLSNKDSLMANLIDEELTLLPIQIMITPNSFDLAPIKKSIIVSPRLVECSNGGGVTSTDHVKMPGSVKRECFVLGDFPLSEGEEEDEEE